MWKYFGTFVNALTVLAGSSIGLMLRKRSANGTGKASVRDPLPDTMMACLGLCTIFAAASGLLGVESGAQAIDRSGRAGYNQKKRRRFRWTVRGEKS